jgi:hypothetical protein
MTLVLIGISILLVIFQILKWQKSIKILNFIYNEINKIELKLILINIVINFFAHNF